ncbi:MAG: D-cysteine desulfhydrase family protein [Actinobacteria bacterium]|nr:D-cysteine desulfhydrase family protein [Actinomycetota bacterium]
MSGLGGLPRLELGSRPSPLEHRSALAFGLDVDVDLWVKRDDLYGPGVGGNKIRKLEYVVADALQRGCDTLVTTGAVQSNHARLTAVAGAVCGLDVHLVLDGDPVEKSGGNLVLDRLAGAELHFVRTQTWDELNAATQAVADELAAAGRRCCVIPVGASMPLGAVGYADAYLELLGQLDEVGVQAEYLVHACGSGGTQGGLLAGRALAAGDGARAAQTVPSDAQSRVALPRVVGVDVARSKGELAPVVAEIAAGCLGLVGGDGAPAADDPVLVDGTGPAYGVVTPEGVDAITVALRTCGILLDPVYSGKALGALPELVEGGVIRRGATVVFLHTGGSPALFASSYSDAIVALL